MSAQAHGIAAYAGNIALLTDGEKIVERLLRAGLMARASDIHLDPQEDCLRVRLRIDGQLEDFLELPPSVQTTVTGRLKVLASLDIAEKRAPQDGAFSWSLPAALSAGHSAIDVRIATLPVRHGERVTLRLLEKDAKRLTLDELGMSADDRLAFDAVLKRPHGLVLLTGPTGSGKTTTLYATIGELLRADEKKNILTVEDPVEYDIPGVAQAEVDSADKVNFSKALRSLLRHDPDVIMIGEIRDADSLDVAVKASLTGHLVLSTLHANSAKSSVTRLTGMGLDPALVPATLRLAVAQRLARRLCPCCRKRGETGFEPVGCPDCDNRGYRGRIGLFSLYSPDGGLETSMEKDAADKVRGGVTSFAEALKCCPSPETLSSCLVSLSEKTS